MNTTEFYSKRYERALQKANDAIGAGSLERAEAYARAARHYNFATAIAAGKAMALDEIVEILKCEAEAISYSQDSYAEAKYSAGLHLALGLVLKHQQKEQNHDRD